MLFARGIGIDAGEAEAKHALPQSGLLHDANAHAFVDVDRPVAEHNGVAVVGLDALG